MNAAPMETPSLKPEIRTALEQDVAAIDEQLTNPNMKPYLEDPAALHKQKAQIERTLAEQAPKPYEGGKALDDAVKLERELREQFTVGMLSEEEMRRNRPESVYKHMKWEAANKATILRWREVMKRIHHDSDDPTLTSYEKFRPYRPFVYDSNAQIAGHHAMSPQAKENWPLGAPKAKTAIDHLAEALASGEAPATELLQAMEAIIAKYAKSPERPAAAQKAKATKI